MGAAYHPIPKNAIMVQLPDTQQKKDYSCGASAVMSVCRYFGVGLDYEDEFIALLRQRGMDRRVGAHPHHLKRVLRRFRLACQEYCPMALPRLKSCLRRGQPVLMMIQAYGVDSAGEALKSYKGMFREGHWVVAIGFDRTGIFFEDPSLEAIRGYIPFAELEERWQDTGPHGKHLNHYGLAVFKPAGFPARSYARRARHIE